MYKEFDSRDAVLSWIYNNQLSRRNIDNLQKTYIIGMLYKKEKKANGGDRKSVPQNEEVKSTAEKIADRYKMSHATVERAEKVADEINEIAKNVGETPYQTLAVLIAEAKITFKNIDQVAKLSAEKQRKVVDIFRKKGAKSVDKVIKEINSEGGDGPTPGGDDPQPEQPKNVRADFITCVSDFVKANPEYETAEIIRNILVYEGAEHSPEVRSHLIADFEVLRREVIGEDSDEVFIETVHEYMDNSDSRLAFCVSGVINNLRKDMDVITEASAIGHLDTSISKLREYIIDIIGEYGYEKSEVSPESSDELEDVIEVVEEKDQKTVSNDYVQYDLTILQKATDWSIPADLTQAIGLDRSNHNHLAGIRNRCKWLADNDYMEKTPKSKKPSYRAKEGAVERYLSEGQKLKVPKKEKHVEDIKKPKTDKPTRRESTGSCPVSLQFRKRLEQLQTELGGKTQAEAVAWLLENKTIDMNMSYEKPEKAKGEKNKNLRVNKDSLTQLTDMQNKYNIKSNEEILWRLLNSKVSDVSSVHPSKTEPDA